MSKPLARRNRDPTPFLSHLCPSPCPRCWERPCIYSFMKTTTKLRSAKQRKRARRSESQENMKKKFKYSYYFQYKSSPSGGTNAESLQAELPTPYQLPKAGTDTLTLSLSNGRHLLEAETKVTWPRGPLFPHPPPSTQSWMRLMELNSCSCEGREVDNSWTEGGPFPHPGQSLSQSWRGRRETGLLCALLFQDWNVSLQLPSDLAS